MTDTEIRNAGVILNDPVDGEVVVVKGCDVQVGDCLMFLGTEHIVHRIEPYGLTNIPHIITPDTRVARSGPTWEMTLMSNQDYPIRPRVSIQSEES